MIINGNCLEVLPTLKIEKPVCIVTDPPFNIGYHYKTYKDRLNEAEYYEMLKEVLTTFNSPYVVIHYPESINRLSIEMGEAPSKVCEWVYNSNNRRQHRSVAYYRVNPIFSQVKQPYKNPNDKRVKKLIENGSGGANIYDWWNVNQVKNVSAEKTRHPCQMPLEVMEKVVGIIPNEYLIIDPFMGSGTTGIACLKHDREFIGIEMDPEYFQIAKDRIENFSYQTSLF